MSTFEFTAKTRTLDMSIHTQATHIAKAVTFNFDALHSKLVGPMFSDILKALVLTDGLLELWLIQCKSHIEKGTSLCSPTALYVVSSEAMAVSPL